MKILTNSASAMDINVGCYVRVLRKAACFENGWNNTWVSSQMDCMVGKVSMVRSIDYSSPIMQVKLEDNFLYPEFVLEVYKGVTINGNLLYRR